MPKLILDYRCPLCGSNLFLISCRKKYENIRKLGKEFCLTVEDSENSCRSKCNVNCCMICSRTRVTIFQNPEMNCETTNRYYEKIVKNFPIGLLSSGFQIA